MWFRKVFIRWLSPSLTYTFHRPKVMQIFLFLLILVSGLSFSAVIDVDVLKKKASFLNSQWSLKTENNFFRELRNVVIEIVLATDMSTHFVQIKTMKNMLSLPEGWVCLHFACKFQLNKTTNICLYLHTLVRLNYCKHWLGWGLSLQTTHAVRKVVFVLSLPFPIFRSSVVRFDFLQNLL